MFICSLRVAVAVSDAPPCVHLRHVAPPLSLGCGCPCSLRQREVLVRSPRRSPSRFAPAAFPRGWLGFPPCRPPCNPPAKPPFRATKRLILWGGLFRGKTHFRGGNLALLSPLRGGQWTHVRLASWRVCPKRHPQAKGKRKGKQDRQPLQRRNMRFGAARKIL